MWALLLVLGGLGVGLVLAEGAARVVELYSGEKLRQDFERTRSRLIEMQTHDYLASPHRP